MLISKSIPLFLDSAKALYMTHSSVLFFWTEVQHLYPALKQAVSVGSLPLSYIQVTLDNLPRSVV